MTLLIIVTTLTLRMTGSPVQEVATGTSLNLSGTCLGEDSDVQVVNPRPTGSTGGT